MRTLTKKTRTKRGCDYCLDMRKEKPKEKDGKPVYKCIHGKCPYHELDKHETYDDYLKSEDSRMPFDRLFEQ